MSEESKEIKYLQKKRLSPDDEIKEHSKKIDNISDTNLKLNLIQTSSEKFNSTLEEKSSISDTKEKKQKKKLSEKTRDEIINKQIKTPRSFKSIKETIQKGIEIYSKKKEYDLYLLYLIKYISNILDDFKEFKDDYTYYIYNNLRVLNYSNELNESLKKIAYNNDNEIFIKEFKKFSEERWKKFIEAGEKYNIKLLKEYQDSIKPELKKKKQNLNIQNIPSNPNINKPNNPNNNETLTPNNNTNPKITNNNITSNNISTNINSDKTPQNNIYNKSEEKVNQNNQDNNTKKEAEKFDINKSIEEYKYFPEDNQLEIIIAGMIFNSMIKNEKELPKESKEKEKDKYSLAPINPEKFEIQNFNLPELAMVSVISGFKFNTNIIEVNLSGNPLSPKSCFWLGSAIKTNYNLLNLDIQRCAIDNDKLYMLIEGTKFSDPNLNKEQFNLERLNLKDNNQIIDNNTNSEYEHPLAMILEKFKLKWINLTNAKIGGSGALKFFKKMDELLSQNKLYLQNMILICNDFKNEECLGKLGELILRENCPLKNVILSKNLISTSTQANPPVNYYEKFMKSVGKCKIKELFLISCDIGINQEDINILYDMLKENKSLISIRLFGNRINTMENFTKILGIFSDYNKPLENSTLKSLDLSKNQCSIKVDNEFMKLVENLKLEYLDINQNTMEASDKEIFRKGTNDLPKIKIIY